MKKLKLDIEAIAVESFATSEDGGVQGNILSFELTCAGCPAPAPTGKTECTCQPGASDCYSTCRQTNVPGGCCTIENL